MSDNVIDLVQEAQRKGKFSLADAIKGSAYPEKSVDIYLDAAAAAEFAEVSNGAKLLDAGTPEHDAAIERMEKLSEKIKESKLTFHMRGVGQGIVEKATELADAAYPTKDGIDDPNWIKHYLCHLIAENIVKVTDAEGNEDSSKFTVEDIMQLRSGIPIDAWEVLVDTMQKLTLASSYFDAVTDAGFLPKS